MNAIGGKSANLTSGYPAVTRKDWRAAVSRSLAGRPVSGPGAETADGIGINPLYERAAEPIAIPGMPSSPPLVMPLVIETEPGIANRVILDELEGGAAGIVLQMDSPGGPGLAMVPDAVDAALVGVDLDVAKLFLAPGSFAWLAAAEVFAALAHRVGSNPCGLNLGADPIGAALASNRSGTPAGLAPLAKFAGNLPDKPTISLFSASGTPAHEAGATEALELSAMLASGAAYLRALTESGLSPQAAFGLIGLELSVDGDVFVSAAKLRAARLLWLRIIELCDGGEHRPRLHVRSSARMMAKKDVHVNMVRTTACSLAAALGGADCLTVLPFTHALGQPGVMARRIARNQMIVLAEEAFVGKVADPASGSGFIEHLTNSLTNRAWSFFQMIERAGGAASPAGAKVLRDLVADAGKTRSTEIASGQRQIVGVNVFVNADDRVPVVEPWPA